MLLGNLLSHWRSDPSIAENIVEWRSIPARSEISVQLPDELHPALKDALEQRGITSLFTHQAEVWEHLQLGENIAIVTGTASGKTLCYNLPVLNRLLSNPEACAIYLFPTKALAQDQLSGLKDIHPSVKSLTPSIYDGDTPNEYRSSIRSKTRLLITNPDMLHLGILPHHTFWERLIRHLHFVVIDEMHVYRGVFGSHVANVIRRLKRLARFYGSHPQFILTSATIANASDLAERLIEDPVTLIDQDGSGRGAQTFLIYNPPFLDRNLGLRRSAFQESVRLAEDLLAYQLQTIVFARTRRTVELILTDLRQRPRYPLPHSSSKNNEYDQSVIVRGYRSGYLPAERRAIEKGLRDGKVRAVIATNALELGIDIGEMSAAVLVGYPGTIAATWQQAGRAGRGQANSLKVLIATANPLDQFLASHPQYLFERSPEYGLINPDNPIILLNHLRCAAFELPFQPGDCFGRVKWENLEEYFSFLIEQGVIHRTTTKYYWMSEGYPAQEISLRSTSTNPVILQTWQDNRLVMIGQIDQASAHWMVHPQAVYLHEGQTYLVENLDLEKNLAYLRPMEIDYYTEPRQETSVEILEKINQAEENGAVKGYGEIRVTSQVIGFRKIKWHTHEQLGIGEVFLPPYDLVTAGYWLALQEKTVESLRDSGLWSNDPNDYGANWVSQSNRARERDGYSCQVCGIPEEGKAHHVHHKTPFRLFSDYEQANQLSNLITLCPRCHRRVEVAVRVHSGLAGLSFVLGNLAPFFLMCDPGDLGIHSDPQSPIADGQPTVVIYERIPAGIGFSQRLYEIHAQLIQRALELVSACQCADGCPSCVGPGGMDGMGGKREAMAILKAIASQPLA